MTLHDLISNVMLQGNIDISVWHCGEEVHCLRFTACDMLTPYTKDDNGLTVEMIEDYEITYMFAPGDDFMHIEVDGHDWEE